MVKINRPSRPRLSSEDVMAQLTELAPHLVEHCRMDREWIWYCGPSLQGEGNRATREIIKQLCFRFSPGGHVMADGAKGHWGNACLRPTPTRRKSASRTDHATEQDFIISQLADLGL